MRHCWAGCPLTVPAGSRGDPEVQGLGGGSSGVSGSEGVRRGSPPPRSAGPTPGCRGNAVFLLQQGAWPGAQGPNSSRGGAPAPRSASLRAPQVTNEITPVLSYSYVAVLVPIFLLTDYLRYKPVLVLQSLSHISIWLLLVLGTSVLAMQLMEFFYGVTMAARIAYSSYIFSLVAPSRYQRMASYSRTAVLLGVFTSSVLGQLCVTLGSVPFLTLNYVSLGFVTFGLLLTLFLERPKRSLFFNRPEGACNGAAAPTELDKMAGGDGEGAQGGWRDMVLCRMLREVCALAKQSQLQLWSCWWVFNSAGYYLVLYYVQILWNEIYPAKDNRRVYNGGVDAASTLLGRLCSWGNCGSGWGGSPSVLGKAVVTLLHAVQYPGGGLRARCRSSSLWGGSSRCPLCVSPPQNRGHRLLCGRPREDPLGAVVGTGDRVGDGRPGGAADAHEHHQQHLAVLRRLRPLPRLLPVPGAHRHVRATPTPPGRLLGCVGGCLVLPPPTGGRAGAHRPPHLPVSRLLPPFPKSSARSSSGSTPSSAPC